MGEKLQHLDWPALSHNMCLKLETRFKDAEGWMGFYWPIALEFDIRPYMNFRAKRGEASLPIFKPHEALAYHPWEPGQPLTKMANGLFKPSPVEWAAEKEIIPALILVPLLGVDENMYRLGRGGGAFDKTMAYYRGQKWKTKFIGLASPAHLIQNFPREEHDQPLDEVLWV